MNLKELHDIEKLEKDLWEAADQLRTNSKLTSSDYRADEKYPRPSPSKTDVRRNHPLIKALKL